MRHYFLVDVFSPSTLLWNAVHQTHRLMYISARKGMRMIIDSFDEAGRDDWESEQRKIYHECTSYLYGYGDYACGDESTVKDVHIVRVNSGYNQSPSKEQAQIHAGIIKDIKRLPFPDKPSVTVHLLGFERDHSHVEAYQARMMPPSNKVERAKKVDEWDSKPMYDNVLMYSV